MFQFLELNLLLIDVSLKQFNMVTTKKKVALYLSETSIEKLHTLARLEDRSLSNYVDQMIRNEVKSDNKPKK